MTGTKYVVLKTFECRDGQNYTYFETCETKEQAAEIITKAYEDSKSSSSKLVDHAVVKQVNVFKRKPKQSEDHSE